MQFTAVFLKRYIFGDNMSLNDVCCYIPAWFGVIASFLVGCIAYEASLPQNTGANIFGIVLDALRGKYASEESMMGESQSRVLGLSSPAVECAAFAMGFMAVVPAHLMRSVGGGYDNESVAVTAMTLTFYLWMRSLRNKDKYSYLFGALAGVAYFNMVAAWGGYIFVLNLIGAHAAFLVLTGRFCNKVYLAYTLFYSIGTSLAIQVPVVGWSPLKSLEQLAPCAVFLGYQVLQYCEIQRKQKKMSREEAWKFRVKVFGSALAAATLLVVLFTPKSYFGPISSRVRGLFVPHTKTGNPLVDSVAEHQVSLIYGVAIIYHDIFFPVHDARNITFSCYCDHHPKGCVKSGVLAIPAPSLLLGSHGIWYHVIPLWRLGRVPFRLCHGSVLLLAQDGSAHSTYCPDR